MSTSSRTSSSTSTSSVSFILPQMPSTTPANLATLPSFAHSLSSLPRMTSVTSDMVHYGTLARTKQASEAKVRTSCHVPQVAPLNSRINQLQTALQNAKQRPSGTYPCLVRAALDSHMNDIPISTLLALTHHRLRRRRRSTHDPQAEI